MNAVRLWTFVYYAERFAAGAYWEFAGSMPSAETRATMKEFGDDERMHAVWFAEALAGRGKAEPSAGGLVEGAGRRLGGWFIRSRGPRRALAAFHQGEKKALAHLNRLIASATDAEVKASLERIRPYEEKHTYWYPERGRALLVA